MMDAKSSDNGLANSESNASNRDKHFAVSVKKTALRDVQNESRIPSFIGNAVLSKDRGQMVDTIRASGTKRASPEEPVDLPHPHISSSNSPNSQFVYVRRKSDAEMGKSAFEGGTSGLVKDTALPKPPIQQKASSFPAFVAMHASSTMSESGMPSVPPSLSQSSTRYAPAEPEYHHAASAIPSFNSLGGMKDLHWEERYRRLQILLKKLDESYLDDYVHVLRSVSSVELSILAVELERRSIQLSLEEGKEMQRVQALNVLGKLPKAPSVAEAQANK